MQLYTFLVRQLCDCYPEGEARALARLVISEHYHLEMTDLYMGKDKSFLWEEDAQLLNIIDRLRQSEPIQYIFGKASFKEYDFSVRKGVLIPRPETAELVDWVLAEYSDSFEGNILDVGSGSGCIPIVLSLKRPRTHVVSVDISEEALSVSRENNERLGAHVEFRRCDILTEEPDGFFDVIISNPPYVCPSERSGMELNVLDWEPELALFVPEDDPLLFYRRIAQMGLTHLAKGGKLFFEINQSYGKDVVEMLASLGYENVLLKQDFYGKDRMVQATKLND